MTLGRGSTFVQVRAPADDEPGARLLAIIARLIKLLVRRSVLVEDMGETCLAEPDADGDEALAKAARQRLSSMRQQLAFRLERLRGSGSL